MNVNEVHVRLICSFCDELQYKIGNTLYMFIGLPLTFQLV